MISDLYQRKFQSKDGDLHQIYAVFMDANYNT
jgi:hypothetical protein